MGLTLASRPVMAWHCNTTSAWGSAVLRNGGASVQARADAAVLKNTECWTTSNWKNNSIRTEVSNKSPWSFVVAAYYPNKSVDTAQKKLTVNKLFPSGLKGTSGTDNVLTLVSGDSRGFASMMLVARLNTLFAGHRVAQCTVSSNGEDMLLTMANQGVGVFKPANSTGAAWTLKNIQDYLYGNYLVS
ncbi:MAG: hypothetical protein ABW220_12635 [Burkholderiaceae bacterium]